MSVVPCLQLEQVGSVDPHTGVEEAANGTDRVEGQADVGALVEQVAVWLRIVVWDPVASTLSTLLGGDFDEIDGSLATARVRIPREAFQLPTGEVVVFDRETARIRAIGGL